jgi:hypothetical protein
MIVAGLLIWGALSDERAGLSFTIVATISGHRDTGRLVLHTGLSNSRQDN